MEVAIVGPRVKLSAVRLGFAKPAAYPDRRKSMAPSFTKPDDPLYTEPTIDPKDFDDFAVFRETFLSHIHHVGDVSAFRGFADVLYEMASEARRFWRGTYAEATASKLNATVADLRYLQGYLAETGTIYDGEDEDSLTPRNKFYYQAATRMALKVAALADEMEAELRAALEEVDE
jgi:hypothetical protein